MWKYAHPSATLRSAFQLRLVSLAVDFSETPSPSQVGAFLLVDATRVVSPVQAAHQVRSLHG